MDPSHYLFDSSGALLETRLPLPRRAGKVRDVYDLGDCLAIVSSDRISAFDFVLPVGIPGKGCLLTKMSEFWFDALEVNHHCLGRDFAAVVAQRPDLAKTLLGVDFSPLVGRTMITRKANVVPFECVVRGYLEGSGWREYQTSGEVCGNRLPAGLKQCDRLPEPIFTPSTKAQQGHDENVSIDRVIADVGQDLALELKQRSLDIYAQASRLAADKGLLIADTKFEFGRIGDEILLIDEVLTPDSSRFWDANLYSPGQSQPSFDKQYVRQWLSTCGWDKVSDPPTLPPEVVKRTMQKYQEAYDRLTDA
jgi:phosphoribosylaminoimidazole-succinocarboxamide synthase